MITDLPAAEETAAQYGVQPVVVPGVAHDFMLVCAFDHMQVI